MPSLRVFFRPRGVADSGSMTTGAAAELALLPLGAGPTKAKTDEAQPATIVFHVVYLDQVRGDPKPAPERFATLTGEILLQGSARTPLFRRTGAQEPLVHDDPPETTTPRRRPRRRSIELHLSAGSFGDVLLPSESALRLFLPHPANARARFAEIDAELSIGGDVEAPLGTGDRLDVRLPPLQEGPIFEWPDALGRELPEGLSLTLTEGAASMTLRWTAGVVSGGLRRFVFHRLPGEGPCTLVARASGRELKLLDAQALDDLDHPIVWEHWLEEMIVAQGDAADEIDFAATPHFPHGRV